jgi:hypothetical protein
MTRDVTFTIESTGAQIIDMSRLTKVQGNLVPALHRVAANLCNLCAAVAQAEVRQHLEDVLQIRQKWRGRSTAGSRSKATSFIANQTKITKFAHAKDFPNISCELRIDPNALNSPRNVPLILPDLEEGGTQRAPFIGENLAWPITKQTRAGGRWAGKVRKQYQWENLGFDTEGAHSTFKGLRYDPPPLFPLGKKIRLTKKVTHARAGFRMGDTSPDRKMVGHDRIYWVRAKNHKGFSYVWKGQGKGRPSVPLYRVGPGFTEPKKIRFFQTARRAVHGNYQDYFARLVQQMGSERGIHAVADPFRDLARADSAGPYNAFFDTSRTFGLPF